MAQSEERRECFALVQSVLRMVAAALTSPSVAYVRYETDGLRVAANVGSAEFEPGLLERVQQAPGARDIFAVPLERREAVEPSRGLEHGLAARVMTRGGFQSGLVVALRADPPFEEPDKAVLIDAAQVISGLTTDVGSTGAELERTRAFFREVVESVPVAVFVKDMWDQGRYIYLNRAGEEMTGRSRQAFLGRSDWEIFSTPEATRFVQHDRTALNLGQTGTFEEKVVHRPNGNVRVISTRKIAVAESSGEPRYVLGVSEDITEQRDAEVKMRHMAHHDALTGLPNRWLLAERLSAALETSLNTGSLLALICIDLDGFKQVNDNRGHAMGDQLLRDVARRLEGTVRPQDTAGRLGGDEFVVIHSSITHCMEARHMARRITSILSEPFELGSELVPIGCSIGISLAPEDGLNLYDLLDKADSALYGVKREKRNSRSLGNPAA